MKRKILCCLLTLFLLSGCESGRAAAPPDETAAPENPPMSAQLEQAQPRTVSYPLTDAPPLLAIVPCVQEGLTSSAPAFQSLTRATGIPVRIQLIPQINYIGNFLSLYAAASDFPDLVWGVADWDGWDLEDTFLDLTPYLQTDAPNYVARVTETRDTLLAALPDQDGIYRFSVLLEQAPNVVGLGPVVREDLLQKYGLPLPETYDEWTAAMAAIRSDVDDPLSLTPLAYEIANYFASGYDVSLAFRGKDHGFYQVDGQVKFGMMEEGFTALMNLLADWREQGFITEKFTDLADISTSDYLLKQASGVSGIFFLTYDKLDTLNAVSELPGFSAALLPDPVQCAGTQTHLTAQRLSQVWGPGFSVSAECGSPETAVRFVDYLYSEAGIQLTNLGTEGITCTGLPDAPTFTEAAIADRALLEAHTGYAMAGVYSYSRLLLDIDPQLLSASESWSTHRDSDYHLPPLILDEDDQSELARLQADLVFGYALPEVVKLIAGDRSPEEIPEIQAHLKKIGLDRCLELLQSALDEYLAR